jgi:hypothetical protein
MEMIMAKKPTKPEVNPFEGVVNQVVNPDGSIVPVQYVADPTAVFTLSAEHYAEIVDLADDWFDGCDMMGKGKTLRSDSAKSIKRMLGENPTYPQYMAYRQAFVNQLLSSGKTKNETSASQMWTELMVWCVMFANHLPFLRLRVSLRFVWLVSGIRRSLRSRKCPMQF